MIPLASPAISRPGAGGDRSGGSPPGLCAAPYPRRGRGGARHHRRDPAFCAGRPDRLLLRLDDQAAAYRRLPRGGLLGEPVPAPRHCLWGAWRQARTGLFSIFTFTTLTLVVTLLHLDRFHFGAAEPLPRVAAWAWLAVYLTTPVAFALGLWAQGRQPGVDSPPSGPLPALLRLLFLVQTVVFAVFAQHSWSRPWPRPLGGLG